MESQPQNPEFRINPETFTHPVLSSEDSVLPKNVPIDVN